MFLEESTVHRLTLYPDEEGSGGKKVYFWAYSSCKSKMGKHSCAHLQCTVKSIKSLNHRLTAPCTTTFNPRLYYSQLSSPPCCAHFFFSFQLPISRRCSPALSEEDLEAIWTALRYGQLKAVVSHTPDNCRWVDVFIRDLSCKHFPEHHSKGPLRGVKLYLFKKSHWGQNILTKR